MISSLTPIFRFFRLEQQPMGQAPHFKKPTQKLLVGVLIVLPP